ncbi:MAG: hypothetical protein ACI4KA_10890 [Oscillospiraceae bacterium]
MRKTLCFSIIAAILLLMCSCSTPEKQNDDSFVIGRTSLCGNIVVSADSNLIVYTDLNDNSSAPACVQSGCTHDRNSRNCTAYIDEGQIIYPFIYNDSLYYFYNYDVIELYKCDKSGGNKAKIYTYKSEPSNADEICGSPVIASIGNKDSKLYVCVVDTIMKKEDTASVSSGREYFSIIEIDLSVNSTKLVYNTDALYDGNLSILSVGNDSLFCYLTGQTKDYSAMGIEDRLELLENSESEYWESYLNQTIKIDINSGVMTVLPETNGMLAACGDEYYYLSADNHDELINSSGEVVFSGSIMSFLPYKNELILITSDLKTYLISENESKLLFSDIYFSPNAINESFVFGYDEKYTRSYCKNEEFLSGELNVIPLNISGGLS